MRKLLPHLAGTVALAFSAAALSADLTLTQSAVGFNTPIGIDFQDPSGKLIMSVNYPTGAPYTLQLINPDGTGLVTGYAGVVGLNNEVKIATVRASGCQGGFTAGESFIGSGVPGEVLRIDAAGTSATHFVTVSTSDDLRGSFFQDRFCAAGGDLIVVSGNEQSDPPINTSQGTVWRVNSAGVATGVGQVGTHLEGVTTIPNIPALYGPLAGRILAGAEEIIFTPGTPPTYPYGNGRIYAFNPNAFNDYFTIGAGSGLPCDAAATIPHCNFATATPIHPEDLDLIRKGADFFGIAYDLFPDGRMLTAPASNFTNYCGQLLVTQELPVAGTSGLSVLSWNAATQSFGVKLLSSNLDPTTDSVKQWEHVTFTSGSDCSTILTLVKTPKNASFNIGDPLTFTLVVTNSGLIPAVNAKVHDPLPTTGGLTWTVSTQPTGGSCSITSQVLDCNLGDLAAGDSRTIVVMSNGAPAAACTAQNNLGQASADNAAKVTDTGAYTCKPPGQQLGRGDTATIGFWANKNGQGVITCENKDANSTALGNWLASNFPNLFGNLAGNTNTQVAAAFITAKSNVGGVQGNTYAQAFAVGLAMYVTSSTTGTASCVSKFGFNFGTGTGANTYNVGSNGAALGVPNNTSLTVLQVLQLANASYNATTKLFYGGNQTLTSALNNVLNGINQNGDIS